jgi:hypothetical protein
MANALFDSGRQGFLTGTVDWDTNTFALYLIDHGTDTPNVSTDDNVDDLLVGARIGPKGTMTASAPGGGVADATDVTLATVSGASAESINIFKDSGVESTSTLVAFIDTATGLPVTPNGGNINIVWDNGANRIFKL